MNTSEARAYLENFHEVRKFNDPARVLPFFADDACFSIAGEECEGSIAGQFDGRAALEAVLDQLLADWNWINVDFKSILTEGDLIVVWYDLTVEHVPSKTTVTTDIVDFMELRAGKVVNMRQFVDTAHLSKIALGAV